MEQNGGTSIILLCSNLSGVYDIIDVDLHRSGPPNSSQIPPFDEKLLSRIAQWYINYISHALIAVGFVFFEGLID